MSYQHFLKTCEIIIPKSYFYRYLQLRNFAFSKCFPSCPPTSLLDSVFDCKLVRKRTISTIYEILYSHNLTPLDLLKNKWETNLNETITNDTCHKIIQGIFSYSICLRHAVIQFKIVHRLHWSKVRLSRIKADIDHLWSMRSGPSHSVPHVLDMSKAGHFLAVHLWDLF